ncbi:MAG TPA: ATP-binding protein [Methylomirabilota bacterium]|nr:ATP-binding protein [Methylomirabilota bacterium]
MPTVDAKNARDSTDTLSFTGSRPGGRLLRRTFLVSLLLVSVGLIASGALELFFSYREKTAALGELQREMAQAAAFKIQLFVDDIERTMRASTQTQGIVTSGLTQDFRFELIKLLKVAPAITEVVAVDTHGQEVVKVSRVRTTLPDDLKERAIDLAFTKTRGGKSFFGKVYFVRKSEPYMTIAVPIERFAGDVIGVLIGEVNLKYIWDVVSAIKVGTAGYAYVISADGDLIAHPDISFVLEKRNLKQLGQVKAALARQSGPLPAQPNLIGQKVLPAFAPVADLGWAVLIERPVSEAYAALYASTLRTFLLLLVGLGMAGLASFLIGRRVVRPIEILRRGAARIGRGDLDHRLEIKTNDELQSLADEFNNMTAQLQESYANLEHKVEDRTRELTESLEQQTATSEVLRVIASSPTDIQPVLNTVIESAVKLAGATQGHIRQYDGEFLQLVATYGETPEQIAILRATPIRPIPETRSGSAFIERKPVHVLDAQEGAGQNNPAVLTGARTLLVVPLLREGAPIGNITIWRSFVEPFTEKQIELVQTFANQAVIAIENVRLFQEIQEKNQQLEAANRHKSQFLANVSHELRTPLNSIIGFTRIVLRRIGAQIPDLQKDNLRKVLISSEHLLNLINELLDLAKIESGRMEVYAETFKLDDIVRMATSTVEPMLKDGRVRLVTEIAPNIPPLKTDRDKLKQAVLNLLSNSAKFTEKGEIKVSAWQENGNVKLTVSDTGIGMKKEALDFIFDEFRQADMSSTRKYGGTGLGLAIVKKFINLMGGEIGVESEVGKGSKFTITIPVELKR